MNNKNKIIIITIVGISVVLLGFIIFFLNIQKEKNITYNVTFNSNGGTNIKEQIVNQGDLVKKPADPKKDGYMFIEWTYKGKTYDFSLKVESDLTLNAKWIEIEEDAEKFIIKFETDGGTTISNQVIEKGNKITKPIDPVKDGYIFKGWILNDEFYDFEKTIEENIELKAKWEKIKGNNNNTTNNNSSNNNNTSTNSTTNNNNTTNNDNKNETTNNSTKKWTVRFMCNGNLVTTKEIENNKTVSKPSPPSVPNGMKFKYWSIDGNEFNFNTKITKDYVIDCSYSRLESDTPTVDNDITSAPTNIYFSNENFIGTVNQSIVEVTWDSVKNADSYYIYFSSSENGNYVEKTGVSTTRVRFALENDGYYKIQATNSDGKKGPLSKAIYVPANFTSNISSSITCNTIFNTSNGQKTYNGGKISVTNPNNYNVRVLYTKYYNGEKSYTLEDDLGSTNSKIFSNACFGYGPINGYYQYYTVLAYKKGNNYFIYSNDKIEIKEFIENISYVTN